MTKAVINLLLGETKGPFRVLFLATGVYKKCKFLLLLAYTTQYMQSWTFDYIWLLNQPYENEVTMTWQNPPLKYCQPLEILTHYKKGLDLSKNEIWGQ